jgi:hypothetical protein
MQHNFWTDSASTSGAAIRALIRHSLKPIFKPVDNSGQGDASSLQARRTLVNERYRFFYRGDDESVCLVSQIDI